MTTLIVIIIVSIGLAAMYYSAKYIPEKSWKGNLPPLSDSEKMLMKGLEEHIFVLAEDIGERHVWKYRKLVETADYIERVFGKTGFEVKTQEYLVEDKRVKNLEVEIGGVSASEEIIVIGAHYDTVEDCPGANDNASGIAALLEMACLMSGSRPSRTLRFVAFVNEEPPFFQTTGMGSVVYARQARVKGEKIVAMFALETIGCYSDKEGSQSFPSPLLRFFYPTTGNFIAFVTNFRSRRLLRQSLTSFRRHVSFPSQGLAGPGGLPGIDWSDHWSFWEEDYPAIMITDTAPYRYPYYHTPRDTPDKIQFEKMTRVVAGLSRMVEDLAGIRPD
ncbi:MAG: M28 family peptidase [Deltaproteobacteria bacterium]|nr:M28 family peptidase [Deltaproteobacteria bacterium]